MLAAAALWSPVRAAACGTSPSPIEESYPVDQQADVPIDVAPWIRGHAKTDAIVLSDARGIEVPINVARLSFEFAEVFPRSPLLTQTKYVLTVPSPAADRAPMRLEFITGDGRSPAPEPPHDVEAFLVLRPYRGQFCEGGAALCWRRSANAATTLDLELHATGRSDRPSPIHSLVSDPAELFMGMLDDADYCLSMATRSASGARSEAIEICGDALFKLRRQSSSDKGCSWEEWTERAVANDADAATPDPSANNGKSDGVAPARMGCATLGRGHVAASDWCALIGFGLFALAARVTARRGPKSPHGDFHIV
jgi:hypothetical protein